MPVMPSPARKQKIVREFFQKRAIELQTAVICISLRDAHHKGWSTLALAERYRAELLTLRYHGSPFHPRTYITGMIVGGRV